MSDLARTQAAWAAEKIVAANDDLEGYELVGITTKGDVDYSPLTEIGGTGLFTSAVRQALMSGECDLAVHSAKDLPAADPSETRLFFPKRADARDTLCSHVPLGELPEGAKVGTGSPRRGAQLRHLRPDLEIVPIRGNVPTRLARIDDDLDAVVLAQAGLDRLGITAGEPLDIDVMLPAPAQGVLALETLPGDAERWARAVNDPDTAQAAKAERAFMVALKAGCTEPLAAHATVDPLRLTVRYAGEGYLLEFTGEGTDPIELGRRLAAQLAEARSKRDS